MKYLVQIMAMLSDVIIGVAVMTLLYFAYRTGSVLFWFFSIILLLLTFNTWRSQGGFIAWTKKGRQSFFREWDKIKRS